MILESKILALLNEVLNQNAKLRKGGTQAVYFCPFCNHWKRKLECQLSTGMWHCWVCHAKGSYLGSLLTKLKAPRHYRDELFVLTKDVRFQRRNRIKTVSDDMALPEEFISLATPPKPDRLRPQQMREYRAVTEYLKKRDIGITDICRYNIGYCTDGQYKDCVVVPSYDDDGKLNYFSARHYYPHKYLKYQNAPFSKNIIGFECFINFSEPVNLVEGVFDAIAVRNNAIPLFGTSISEKLKMALVLNRTKKINIILDNDALSEALGLFEELIKLGDYVGGFDIHFIELPMKDPSELGFSIVHDIIINSTPFDFKKFISKKLQLAIKL